MKLFFRAFALALLPLAICSGQTATPVAPAKRSCAVNKEPASEADKAFVAGDYAKALDLYAAMAASDPNLSEAGSIRTLLAQANVAEAMRRATAWVASQPTSSDAHGTLAEVYYRRGDFPAMSHELLTAQKMDPCNPRMYLLLARFQRLQGNLKTAKDRLNTAHLLAPNDPEIASLWVRSLPPVREASSGRECEPVTPIETAQVPLRPIMDGPNRRVGIALDVLFNGKTRRMEVDTGASGLLLSKGAAQGLGLVGEDRGKADGVGDNGLAGFSSAHVASIRIGGMEFHNCRVEFLEQRSRLDVDGLIGGDFFRKYLLTLDFPSMKMSLDPLPKRPEETANASKEDEQQTPALHDRYIAPEMKDWTRIYSVGHELLAPVGLTSKNAGFKDKLFLIDSGAGLMSISPEAAREVTKVYGDDSVEVSGIAGKVQKTFSTENFDLIFGHLKLPVHDMTSFDTSHLTRSAGVEVSGFLGAPVLFRLKLRIDYRDRLVQFDYDPKNDPINRPGQPF